MRSIPVEPERTLSVAEKLRMTIDLAEAGADVMREKLRRDHPDASEEAIEEQLVAWFRERPGAERGDGGGRLAPERFADS